MARILRDRADSPRIEQSMALTPNLRDIEHAGLFDGLPPDDVKLVLSRSSRQEVPRGFFLYHEGEPAKTMFLLETGRVRLKETTEHGREVLIRLIYPGEVFGAVIADALYRATAQADRPVRASAWTAKAFTELLDQLPRLQKNLFALTKRFMYLSRDRLRMLATASVEHRIGWALAYLAERSGRPRGDGIVIAERSVQRDIADLAATTIYTVNRVLSAYERRGILTKQRGRIVLLRPLDPKNIPVL
jgi:CRP/FNR family transcriptional regulator, nitrogen oxide reductase regulator